MIYFRGSALFVLVGLLLVNTVSSAKDLKDVLPGLYGGDGVQLVDPGGFSHAAHFEVDALTELTDLTANIAEFVIPIPGAISGTTFSFDPVLNDYVSNSGASSPFFTDLAGTIGKGNFRYSVSYTRAKYDEIDGDQLNNLRLRLNHIDLDGSGDTATPCISSPPFMFGPIGACYQFEADEVLVDLDLRLESEVLLLSGVYGLTDKLDISLFVPLIKNTVDVFAFATVSEGPTKVFFAGTLHRFDPATNGDAAISQDSETSTGLGDVFMRGKYNFYSSEDTDMAVSLSVTLPTGDEDNFMGAGEVGIEPEFMYSRQQEIADIAFGFHANLGYKTLLASDEEGQMHYSFALAYGHQFGDAELVSIVEIIGAETVRNKDGFADSVVDGALGFKWNFNENHTAFFNIRVPLNTEGVRADSILAFGYEGNF